MALVPVTVLNQENQLCIKTWKPIKKTVNQEDIIDKGEIERERIIILKRIKTKENQSGEAISYVRMRSVYSCVQCIHCIEAYKIYLTSKEFLCDSGDAEINWDGTFFRITDNKLLFVV